jgi:hypothetical protein
MPIYKITTDFGESLYAFADLAQASAPIYWATPDGDGGYDLEATPHQTADCRHRESELATLAMEAAGVDWWLNPADDPEDMDAYMQERIVGIEAICEYE